MKIPFIQKWNCEIDKYARMSSDANYKKPEKVYIDMLERNNKELPHVDLYVCGFPCQSFSTMGNRLGTKDPRACIIPKMIDTIKNSRPKICILENVRGFVNIEQGIPMKNLLIVLETLGYNVYHSLYNTKNYGLPQNRERVYFVCIRRDLQKKEYQKPKECKMKTFESILVDTKVHLSGGVEGSYLKNLHKIKENTKIIKRDNYYFPIEFVSPTLDTNCRQFMIIKQNRNLLPKEALRLQGFNSNFKQVVTDSQLMKQLGNSMSVNVLKKILREAIDCI
jgi:DNA (cytosine-5)-methyltransferase 1